jgi:hypothetical protein
VVSGQSGGSAAVRKWYRIRNQFGGFVLAVLKTKCPIVSGARTKSFHALNPNWS